MLLYILEGGLKTVKKSETIENVFFFDTSHFSAETKAFLEID